MKQFRDILKNLPYQQDLRLFLYNNNLGRYVENMIYLGDSLK